MPRAYNAHVAKHVTGVRGQENVHKALSEAGALWRGGATRSNPGRSDNTVRWALVGIAAYLGYQYWETHKPSKTPPGGGCGSCGSQVQCDACRLALPVPVTAGSSEFSF